MKRFFSRNIDRKGRIARATTSVILCVGAAFAFRVSLALGIVLVIAGVFTMFEALRGWCVMRACGIKTKL
ncbi:MAG TPA: YgaP-like transmembrane domain [Verrucomicrobiae bacterium]|jgi:hypothetical protein